MNGYHNEETWKFAVHTENTFSLYTDIAAVARECLRRVPGMTYQTLGRNIIDGVRSWIYAVDNGLPVVNLGWSGRTPVTATPRELLELREYVGDLRMVNETDIGESWAEMIREETGR